MLPTVFLSHGGGPAHALDYTGTPFQAMDRNSPSAAFLRSFPKILEEFAPGSQIRAILVISAHWEENQFTVDYQTGDKTKLVYDYYGFDRMAYEPYLTYPAPTDLAVADRVYELLRQNNLPVAKKNRGWDHGTFMPLRTAFPDAKIPIVQLSLKTGLLPEDHFRLGEVLRPLRNEGILIVGSGQITHNLGALDRAGGKREDPRAKVFMDYIHNLLREVRTEADYEQVKRLFISEADKIPHFHFHHPRTEHFIPILTAFAAGVKPASSAASVDPSSSTATASTTSAVVQTTRIYSEVVLSTMGIDSYLFQ